MSHRGPADLEGRRDPRGIDAMLQRVPPHVGPLWRAEPGACRKLLSIRFLPPRNDRDSDGARVRGAADSALRDAADPDDASTGPGPRSLGNAWQAARGCARQPSRHAGLGLLLSLDSASQMTVRARA